MKVSFHLKTLLKNHNDADYVSKASATLAAHTPADRQDQSESEAFVDEVVTLRDLQTVSLRCSCCVF